MANRHPNPQNKPVLQSFDFRGANRDALEDPFHPEQMLCGGADCGKTVALSFKHIIIANELPGYHGALVRKTYNSLKDSVCKTYKRMLAGMAVKEYGGQNIQSYKFANGSEIVLVGLDKPDKLLSSEWDGIQICQAEELSENDFEIASSRATGRGSVWRAYAAGIEAHRKANGLPDGPLPGAHVFADCNPSRRNHWIRTRKSLHMRVATVKDNPELYDAMGNITEEGKRRVERLKSTLTGVRYLRLVEGQWATAEGAVYQTFNAQLGGPHVMVRERSEFQHFYLGVDEGYTAPAVVLLIGSDGDQRLHILDEWHMTLQNEYAIAGQAAKWTKAYGIELCAVDEARPALIATMKSLGVPAKGAKGRIEGAPTKHILEESISAVRQRLVVAGDGKARLTVDPKCINTINEFESYIYRPESDVPLDENNHCMDALRYIVALLERPSAAITDAAKIETGLTEGFSNVPRFMPRSYGGNKAMPSFKPETPEEQRQRIDAEIKKRFG